MKFNKSVRQWNYLKDEDMGFKKHAIVAHQKKKKQNNNVLTKGLRSM